MVEAAYGRPAPDDGLIFPVGHYMGPFHPARGAPARHFVVRVGWDTPKLPDRRHLDVWLLAHDFPDQIESEWTREALVAAAAHAGLSDVDPVIDTLVGHGLLAVVPRGASYALEFAHGYRMHPLLVGLGNAPDDPDVDGLGLPGLAPLLKVAPRTFETWQWGHLWPTIWSTCEGLADVARESGETQPAEIDPMRLLPTMLDDLRTLLAGHAIYLDIATTAARP